MLKKCNKEIEWLEFALLQPYKVKHGIFLRSGGVSKDAFSSLNVTRGIGDLEENVLENRQRLRNALDVEELYFMSQVHGKELLVVDDSFETSSADGLITSKIGAALCVQHADCQAALFYDPKRHALALVHAGWRGNVANIYKATVEKLEKSFGSKPSDLIVCISPSLGPVHAEFCHYKKEFPVSFWSFQVKANYFDLWEIARSQLEEIGIPKEQIEIASICTYSDQERFFSYRRDKITGRHATVGVLL